MYDLDFGVGPSSIRNPYVVYKEVRRDENSFSWKEEEEGMIGGDWYLKTGYSPRGDGSIRVDPNPHPHTRSPLAHRLYGGKTVRHQHDRKHTNSG